MMGYTCSRAGPCVEKGSFTHPPRRSERPAGKDRLGKPWSEGQERPLRVGPGPPQLPGAQVFLCRGYRNPRRVFRKEAPTMS